jgi:aminoglycoside phosphotransferase (APT) family kinase protein
MNNLLWGLFIDLSKEKRTLQCQRPEDLDNPSKVSYDVVILNIYKFENDKLNLGDLLRKAYCLLDRGGHVCLSFNNKYGYRILSKHEKGGNTRNRYCPRHIIRLCQKNGFKNFDIFTLYPDAENVGEVKAGSRYIHKRKAGVIDLIQQSILSSFFMRYHQLAYAIVAHKNKGDSDSFFSQIERRFKVKNNDQVLVGKPSSLVIVLNDKVVRIPLDRMSRVRTRINYGILRSLAKSSIASFVPDVIVSESIMGEHCYVESKIQGIVIDSPGKDLQKFTLQAAKFIADFHSKTAQRTLLNEINFRRLFARDIWRVKVFCKPETQKKIEVIESNLKRCLLGTEIATVWSHGDFKIENVLINKKTQQISGVIDWDLSSRTGLPLMDLIYLFIYSDRIQTKRGVLQLCYQRFLGGNFEPWEDKIMHDYMESLNLPFQLVKVFTTMFWFNTIARRYQQQLVVKAEWFSREIDKGIDEILQVQGGRLQ